MKKLCLVLTVVLLISQTAFYIKAENTQEDITNMDLFTKGSTINGVKYDIFRIPGIVVTGKSGTLIAYTEARTTGSDWAPMNILMRRSTDGGVSWSAPSMLADGVSAGVTTNNPIMITEAGSDTVHLLHCINYHQAYYRRSDDAGLTWSDPVEITDVFDQNKYQWKVIATGPGHGIQLSGGRLIAAVWLANGANDTSHSNTAVSTIYSDDGGATWQMGDVVYYNGKPWSGGTITNPNETTIVELSDGRVMLNTRASTSVESKQHRRLVSISADGATGWSEPYYDMALPCCQCFASLQKYDKNTILFVNPASETTRQRLTVRASRDDGKTWKYSRVLQIGSAAYADLTVDAAGNIYVLYEREGYGYLTLAKFKMDWLTAAPGEALLKSLDIAEGVISPVFVSEIFEYTAKVEAGNDSITVTPAVFAEAGTTVTINGAAVSPGSPYKVQMPGEKLWLEIKVKSSGKESVYTVDLEKGRSVTAWKFEETAADKLIDSSGSGNESAKISNVEYVPGKIGNGIRLSDPNRTGGSYVLVDGIEATRFGTGDFTVAAWVCPEMLTDAQTQYIIFWYGTSSASSRSQWWLRMSGSAGSYSLEFSTGYGSSEQNINSKVAIKQGEWFHVTVQRRAGAMRIYFNGALVKAAEGIPHNVSAGSSTALMIGKSVNSDIRPIQGIIDEVYMYNYAISDAEIKNLVNYSTLNFSRLQNLVAKAGDYESAVLNELLLRANGYLKGEDGVTQGKINDLSDEIDALLRSSFTVSYDANGGEGGFNYPEKYISGAPHLTLTKEEGNIERLGYKFTGWNTDPNGGGVPYAAGDRLTVNANVVLYAQWKEEGNKILLYAGIAAVALLACGAAVFTLGRSRKRRKK